jgi:hypothetical protein
VADGAPQLHPPVAPGGPDLAVHEECRAHRDATLGQPDAGLLNGDLQDGIVDVVGGGGGRGAGLWHVSISDRRSRG